MLNSRKCLEVIKFIVATPAPGDFQWKCKTVDFLVRKSELPGSGVAVTLSCDLSGFLWKHLLQKRDLNYATAQAIVSLQGKFSLKDVESILEKVIDANAPVLQLALKNCSLPFNVNHLLDQALKYKKPKFVQELMKHSPSLVTEHSDTLIKQFLKLKNFDIIVEMIAEGVQIKPALIINEMSKSDIIATESKILSHLKSTLEGQVELFFKAVEYTEFKLAEECLNAEVKEHISLSRILKLSVKGNEEERKQCISFIKGLLDDKISPNMKSDNEMCPLDVVLEFTKPYQAEKIELLTLLIEHGAAIECCTYQKTNQTTLLHIATKFAIETGERCDYAV